MTFHITVSPKPGTNPTAETFHQAAEWLSANQRFFQSIGGFKDGSGEYAVVSVPDKQALDALMAAYPAKAHVNFDVHEVTEIDAHMAGLIKQFSK